MALPHKTVTNPGSGQSITFLQTAADTDGRALHMQTTYKARSLKPAAHYHPHQDEWFHVVSGSLTVVIEGRQKTIHEGASVYIPRNTVHAMWNASDATTVVDWRVEPAMKTEYLLETAMGLAAEGKTGRDGMPPLLQMVLLANRYHHEFRLAKPPFAIQRIVFGLLTPFAYLFGYRARYAKYID